MPQRPRHTGAQGFAGFGPVGDAGIERVDSQAAIVQRLMSHVGGGEVTVAGKCFLRHARRQQVVPAIEHPNAARAGTEVFQGTKSLS